MRLDMPQCPWPSSPCTLLSCRNTSLAFCHVASHLTGLDQETGRAVTVVNFTEFQCEEGTFLSRAVRVEGYLTSSRELLSLISVTPRTSQRHRSQAKHKMPLNASGCSRFSILPTQQASSSQDSASSKSGGTWRTWRR